MVFSRGEPVFVVRDDGKMDKHEELAAHAAFKVVNTKWFRVTAVFGQKQSVVYSLKDINALVVRVQGLQLPGHVPYELKVELIKESLQHVPYLVKTCFDSVAEMVDEFVMQEIDTIFGDYRSGGLHPSVQALWAEFQDQKSQSAQALLDAVLVSETQSIFTFNVSRHSWCFITGPQLTYVQTTEFLNLSQSQLDKYEEQRNGHSDSDIQETAAPTDVSEISMRLCADVKAYWKLASARLAGIVPSVIIVHFLGAIGEHFEEALLRGLSVHAAEAQKRCSEFLAQDPEVE